jgi:hypothetical protein
MTSNWEQIEKSLTELFDRQWYTNHGVLAQQFEAALEQWLGVKNAVCVVNPAIGLTMALECLRINKIHVLSPNLDQHAHNALQWANVTIDEKEQHAALLNAHHLNDFTTLRHQIHVINACGNKTPVNTINKIKSLSKPDQSRWLTVFSFEQSDCIQAQGAGCIATPCDHTAELLRNIRSSYGVRKALQVVKTANGRMSEAQAAFGLSSLQQLKAQA